MSTYLDDGDVQPYHGDVIDVLRTLPAGVAQTCITSPPYWGLRSYLPDGHDDKAAELGLEATPELYVERMVAVFREVWRVLRPDATVWLNLGDSYLPDKQLAGMPWRVAFALQEAGWCLRSDVIWAKCIPNPMPESVTDRPTKAHEYLFLLSKQPRYFYDADAIREPADPSTQRSKPVNATEENGNMGGNKRTDFEKDCHTVTARNRRSVWTIPTQPYPEAHFATYPEALVRPCILAGTSERGECSVCGAPWVREVERETRTGYAEIRHPSDARSSYPGQSPYQMGQYREHGASIAGPAGVTTGWRASCDHCLASTTGGQPQTVLDPFIGSGTTALVARNHGRRCIGIDLSEAYLTIAAKRLQQLSLLAEPS